MPLVIRMSRHGRTNRPFFRIGVFDLRTRRDGPPVEALGWYDPLVSDPQKAVAIDADRVAHWFSKGASVSETVQSFLKKRGIPFPARKTTRDRLAKDAPRRERSAAKRKAGGKAASAPKK
jgi:small subunit ribosomal protein S16